MTESRRAFDASAPTRLDFGGGWTDVPPYPEDRGGFVCNIAINRRARVHVELGASNAEPTTDRLIRAACAHAALTNARVSLDSDFPIGAGLGGSSAAGVALAAALHAAQNLPFTPSTLAEWSRAVEVDEMKIAGGRQDHYAAAFGGALALTFDGKTRVECIALPAHAQHALERRCVLAYTGESRISATTITAVLDAYRDRVPRVVEALARMKSLAVDMAQALRSGDIDALSLLVDEHWREQRSLHPAITTARIDAIEDAARRAGADGLKALGASGGGCVIIFAPDDRVEAVTRAIAPMAKLLAWRLDAAGVDVAMR